MRRFFRSLRPVLGLQNRAAMRFTCSRSFSNKTSDLSEGIPPLPDFGPAPALSAIPPHLRGTTAAPTQSLPAASAAPSEASVNEAAASLSDASVAETQEQAAAAAAPSDAADELPNPFANGAGTVAYNDEEASLLFKSMQKTNIENLTEGTFGVNGIVYHGSIMAFPNFCVLWRPRRWEEVTPESLFLLELIKPRVDLLILGSGSEIKPLAPRTLSYLRRLGINVEVMKTSHAISTFSMLNDEDRRVACACLAYDKGELETEQQEYIESLKTK